MILTEKLTINNKNYIKTWSNNEVYLERDGALYSEAIDPIEANRKYVETDKIITHEYEILEEDYIWTLSNI